MGYAVFGALSIRQLERHIHAVAARTSAVVITLHARKRMQERRVSVSEVYEVLRMGRLDRPPEPNLAKGSLECRMERYRAGRDCAVVVALDDDNPNLLVVTVWSE